MLSEKAHLALLDIRDCILLARGFVEGLSCEAFKESRLHFFAVTRALEIVSEASRRLPDSFREKHSTLPDATSGTQATCIGTPMTMSLRQSSGRPCKRIYRLC
jgi:hypothetical protein